jgi:hypothetical protein
MITEAARPARVAMPKAEYMMEILSFSAVESPSFEWSNRSSLNSEDALSKSILTAPGAY